MIEKIINIKILERHPNVSWLLGIGLLGLLSVFFLYTPFFNWAFERHHNILSWWVRPLILLPFAFSAWYRSWSGIWLSLIAMFSSMFWFPVPDMPDPQVEQFLEMEKTLLQSGWTLSNVLGLISIILYGIFLGMALWKRSLWLGIGIIVLGGILKIFWSVFFSSEAGISVIPAAVLITGFSASFLGYTLYKYSKNEEKI